ncbi:MAG: FAD/NAD(P)-binding protein [Candidatus Woesearchaeota archaeon]
MKNEYIPQKYNITERWQESADNFTIRVDAKLKHEPGQFVQVGLLEIGESPISISSYSKSYIDLNIRIVGNVTKALSRLKKGDSVFIRGPYGRGYPMHHFKGNSIVIIGGGCGVAPLRGVIDYIGQNRNDFKDIYMFLGYRSPDDILFRKQLEEWKKKYKVTMTVDKNPPDLKACYTGAVGFITDAIDKYQMDNAMKIVTLCGPPIMIKKAIETLKKKGFNNDQLFVSEERLMYCGIGKCCHCMIKDKFTCKDGPVFRYDEIADYHND